MSDLFAATGHINYAKSARLYLQTMKDLPKQYPWLYISSLLKRVVIKYVVAIPIGPV